MEVQCSDSRAQWPIQPETTVDTPSHETLLTTAATYLDVFKSLDSSTIAHVQTSDYTHEFAPQSANLPKSFSLDEFAGFLSSLREVIHNLNMTAREIWPNPNLRQVIIWTCSAPEFRDEVKGEGNKTDWDYKGEYIIVLHLDDKGEKVKRVLEFVDSKGTERMLALIAQAKLNKDS